jgi:hypothetical protein
MNRSLPTVVLALSALSFSSVSALTAEEEAKLREAVRQRIAEMKQRLALTPEQEEKLRPIVEDHTAKLRELRAGLGPSPTRSQKRKAALELRELSEEFSKRVEAQLTAEQRTEWKKLRQENRDRLREEVRKRRAAS